MNGLWDYQAYLQLDRQIAGLEQNQQRRAGSVQNGDVYQFAISPTCPPSTSITFQGGWMWWPSSAYYPYAWHIPSYTVDLADSDKVSVRVNYSGYTYTFTNPYWYIGCLIIPAARTGLAVQETWPDTVPDDAIYLRGTTGASPYMVEYESAAEAENSLGSNGQVGSSTYYGVAVSSVILRNNGNTVDANQYLAIDPVNRGRSYLFRNSTPGWEAQ